jgi:hypothetical protein
MNVYRSAVCSDCLATTAFNGGAQFPPLAASRKLFRDDPVHAHSTAARPLFKWEGVVRFRFFVRYPLRSTHSPATTIRTSSPREMNDRPRPRHGTKGVYMQEKGMYVNLRQKEAKRGKRRERREKRERRRLRLPTGSMTRDGRLHDAPSSRVPSPYLPSRAI